MYDLNEIGRHNSSSSSSKSNDSLAGYEGPEMGEPGRPGTRDLDWSIKKLNIKRQVIKCACILINTLKFISIFQKFPRNQIINHIYIYT